MSLSYGIALSGGGARGIAHLGVLAALEEQGMEPSVIAGTSMGAMVGMFYAYGFKAREILAILKKENNPKSLLHAISFKGFSIDLHEDLFKKYIPENDFSILKKPFFVSVANINKGRGEMISEGKLFEYVIASCSIPVVFPARIIDEQTYVDGGLFANLPAEILQNKCDFLIGSHVNHNAEKEGFANKKEVAERCFQLTIAQNVEKSKLLCDLLIEPPDARRFGTFEFLKIEEIFEVGYQEAKLVLSKKF